MSDRIECNEIIKSLKQTLTYLGSLPDLPTLEDELRLALIHELGPKGIVALLTRIEKVQADNQYIEFSELVSLMQNLAVQRVASDLLPKPPVNATYMLFLLLGRVEREVVIGDLVEEYAQIIERFGKFRADIWFYRQVIGSLWPLLRRAILKIGALVWLGRALRRLIP